MRKSLFLVSSPVLIGLMLLASTSVVRTQSSPWVSAYYAGWMQGWSNDGYLKAQDIDYSAFTHIIHFSITAGSGGSINSDANSVTATNSAALVSAAHAAGRKVIISVGGWGSDAGFRNATSAINLPTFVTNLVTFMTSRGYDGIDIDWEVLQSSDETQYVALVTALRTALNVLTPRPLLTAAVAGQPGILAKVQDKFDQINIMTYDLSGAWPGWVTWHNSPVYDGGLKFPGTTRTVPSANGMVNDFLAAGISASKLGVGIDFYGYVWSGGSGTSTGGVTQPRQSWSTAPTVQDNVPYYTIMKSYYQLQYYRWDDIAQASYLSIDNAGSSSDKFISYDDETTVQQKIDYVRSKQIGGAIIWELGGGYRADQPAGQRDLLLQAVKKAFSGATPTPTPDTTPPTVVLTSPTNGSTISGTVTLGANASDNIGVSEVQFKVNGNKVGSEVTSAPYSTTWNSTLVANGTYTVSATARDAAGNQSTASVTVTASNVVTPPTSGGSSDLWVYDENLSTSWLNGSWSVTADFLSTEQRYAGSRAMKVYQKAWGALRLLSGTWGTPIDIDPSKYQSLEFAVFSAGTGLNLSLYLESNYRGSFPTIRYGSIPANQWTIVSVPVSQLDPNNITIQRIVIQDINGVAVTYYIDNLRFVGGSTTSPTAPSVPTLASPSNGAAGLPMNLTLGWNPALGANSYRVQVSTDGQFSSTVVDQAGITASAYAVDGLLANTKYFWRANASNAAGTSAWSSVFSFTTAAASSQDNWVYQDALVSPWVNTSWGATVTFSSTEKVYGGTTAVKVVQNAWGGFSAHSGTWGAPVAVDPRTVAAVEFAIYAPTTGTTIDILLENDQGSSFPRVRFGTVPTNQWAIVSIPMSQLNPNKLTFHRLDIMEVSGTQKTFYLDNIRLTGGISSAAAISADATPSDDAGTNEFILGQNYPNPFNPATTIQFSIPRAEFVSLKVYNVLGEEVATLVEREVPAGVHSAFWNAREFPSGLYIYRLKAGSVTLTKKLNLVK